MEPLFLKALPELWEYNPSKWSARLLVIAFAAIAFLIAIYLGLYQWGLISTVWDPLFGEDTRLVLTSKLSHQITTWIHMPDALLGAISYFGDIIFALAGSTRRWHDRPWLVVLFGLNVIPPGIASALLVFSQEFIVDAWCFLCLISATISLTLIFLAYDEVRTSLILLYRVWKRSKNFSLLWKTFWGHPSHLSHKIGSEIAQKNVMRRK